LNEGREAIMALPRRLETELLDILPADDPVAVRSRRDLKLLNAVMLHPAMMARRMRRLAIIPPKRIVELGAGDGSLMLRLARRLARHWPGVATVLVDQQAIVPAATRASVAELGWRQEQIAQDVFAYLATAKPPTSSSPISSCITSEPGNSGNFRAIGALARSSSLRAAPVHLPSSAAG
jgi:hypothetical protein